MNVKILGTMVSVIDDQWARLQELLHTGKFHQIVTLNPEIMLLAQKDTQYRQVLEGASLHMIDGTGLAWAIGRQSDQKVRRFRGSDVLSDILALSSQHKYDVVILLPEDALTREESLTAVLDQKYEGLSYVIQYIQIERGESLNEDAAMLIARSVERERPQVVICGFGAPEQELYLAQLGKNVLDYGCIAIGVGGALDFLSGTLKRAPRWMQKTGLEWLYRLLQEPKRLPRIWRAVVVFPYKILMNK